MERVNSETQEILTERLNGLIEKAGNVTAFARSIGVSRDSVNNWLLGRSGIRVNDLVKISTVYHVSIDYLLGLVNEKTPDTDKRSVLSYTGLSESALDSVLFFKKSDECRAEMGPSDLSLVLENPDFTRIIPNFDSLRFLYNHTVNAVNFLLDYDGDFNNDDSEELNSACNDLSEYFPELRMLLFELSEMWSDFLESFFPTKELIEDGKKLYRKYIA